MSWKFTWLLPDLPEEKAIYPEKKEKDNKFAKKKVHTKLNKTRRLKNG